jgi:hypothetical protein
MYWIKRFALLTLLAIGLSGCAGMANVMVSDVIAATIRPSFENDKVYMEYIDNAEFLEFILESNIVEGLKREDVIYVDNILVDDAIPRWSTKLILAKNAYYEITSEHRRYGTNHKLDLEKLKKIYLHTNDGKNLDNLDKIYFPDLANENNDKPKEPRWTIPVYTYDYVTPEYILKTEIRSGDCFWCPCRDGKAYSSCDKLYSIEERRGEVKWYQRKSYYSWMGIPHRYNDIHKIKAIIDERVAYFLSLENNQTNATSVDQ